MSLIHEKMYQSEDLALIDFQDYIIALTDDLISTYSINCDIYLDIKIDNVKFDIDTLIPIGLFLNEVISNALKYAFNNKNKGTIMIHLLTDDSRKNKYTLIVGDNGSGITQEEFEEEGGSLGMELIKVFAIQLDGELSLLDREGTVFEIKFQTKK